MGTGINRGVVEKARHYQMYTYAPFSFLFFFFKIINLLRGARWQIAIFFILF